MDPNVLPFVLDGHAKTLALLGAGWLVARLMPRGDAERRHMAYSFAFALALAAPLLALLPARASVLRLPVAETAHLSVLPAKLLPLPPMQLADPIAAGTVSNQLAAPITNLSNVDDASVPDPAPQSGLKDSLLSLLAVLPSMLVWIWAVGVAVFLVRLMASHGIAALGVLAGDPVISGVGPSIARLIAREYGLSETPRLLTSRAARVPYAFGVLNVDVVVPEESENWNGETWSLVLRHELAHARRRDGLWHLMAAVVCALNWFNPLVWREAARLRRESERACDDWVLNSGARPSSYAGLLVEFARSVGQGPSVAMAISRPSDLAERIEAILDPAIKHTPSGGISMRRFAIVFAAALIAASLMNVRVVANENEKPSKKIEGAVATASNSEEVAPASCVGEAWNAVAWEAHNEKLWDYSALSWGNAAKLGHNTAVSEYNVACGYARLGKKDEAIEWLTQAFVDGFGNDDLARHDEDMESLLDDPRFEKAISTQPAETHSGWMEKGKAHLGSLMPEAAALTPDAADEKEAAQRTADRAEWQNFVDSVGPLERQLPESGAVRFRLGFALLILDRPAEAIERFQAAKRLGEDPEKSQYNIACCYAQMGKKTEALTALKEFLGDNTNSWNWSIGPEAMLVDYDLRGLRDEPEFKSIVEQMKHRQHQHIRGVDWKKVWSNLKDTTELESASGDTVEPSEVATR